MKVSFILPSYRDDEHFFACIKALYDQTLNNDEYEIILVDNNCNRQTEYSRIVIGDPRVVYVRGDDITHNQVGRLFRRGLGYAKGDIVCLQNDDDTAVDYKGELMWRFLHDDPAHDALITDFYRVENGRFINMRVPVYQYYRLCRGNYIALPAVAWKRSAWERFYPSTNYRHVWDYATLSRAGPANIRFRKLDIPTEVIYEHGGQMHQGRQELEAKLAEYERLADEMQIPDLASEKIKHWRRQLEKYKDTFALSEMGESVGA